MSELFHVLNIILELYTFALLIYALLSWVNPDPYHPVVKFLRNLCEPVLSPIRNMLPSTGGIDFSVLIVLFVIYILRQLISNSMMMY